MKVLIGAALAFATTVAIAAEGEWVTVAVPSDGDVISVGSGSIRQQPGGYTTFWLKTTYREPKRPTPISKRLMTYVVAKVELHCEREEMRVVDATFYDADDDVVSSSAGSKTHAIYPETIGDQLQRHVCKR